MSTLKIIWLTIKNETVLYVKTIYMDRCDLARKERIWI